MVLPMKSGLLVLYWAPAGLEGMRVTAFFLLFISRSGEMQMNEKKTQYNRSKTCFYYERNRLCHYIVHR